MTSLTPAEFEPSHQTVMGIRRRNIIRVFSSSDEEVAGELNGVALKTIIVANHTLGFFQHGGVSIATAIHWRFALLNLVNPAVHVGRLKPIKIIIHHFTCDTAKLVSSPDSLKKLGILAKSSESLVVKQNGHEEHSCQNMHA